MAIAKEINGIAFAIFIAMNSFSQNKSVEGLGKGSPVSWNYSAKKVSDKVYEVHLKANMNNGWHIYSRKQPKEGIGLPTTVKFTANPLVIMKSKLEEKGKLEKVKNDELGMENHQYENEVDFVQLVTVKANVKTNITGSIEFMACTEERCLPPETVSFSLPLQ